MSGSSIVGFAVGGARLASGLGQVLALDPAEAAARNARIRLLTEQRRDRRAALEAALACAADERERQAQRLITARVDAATAAAALASAGLPPDPALEAPPAGPAAEAWCLGLRPAAEAWCLGLTAAVAAALDRARAATVQVAGAHLAAALSALDDGRVVAAAEVVGPAGPAPTRGALAAVTRMLASLDPRAGQADRGLVEAAAGAAAGRADNAGQLTELRLRIQTANENVARRRDDAVVAAQLLDAVEPYPGGGGLDPRRLAHVRQALAEVVAGRRALDDEVLDEVARLREQTEAVASAATVADAVADALGDLGYLVGPDFSVGTAAAGMLEVSHPAQPDHLVRMRVDADRRQLVALVYRQGAGEEAAKADAEAEAAWCGDLDRAIRQLSESGLVLTPVLLRAPGSRPTPVVAGRAEERTESRHKQRTNQRTER
ncbi:hypothetical protein [Asanoa siamensis]|uniref:Uncharacterized protein n=1 Tax=Asanoa siamensis TaxID=926357 RepID=A0ABQ4CRK1_9ACTN|nr:hypothetical protein [Asanoa siamensis]GIF73914.1 hypothetical protein Asi02nite_34320 [Asanoa siamensis]